MRLLEEAVEMGAPNKNAPETHYIDGVEGLGHCDGPRVTLYSTPPTPEPRCCRLPDCYKAPVFCYDHTKRDYDEQPTPEREPVKCRDREHHNCCIKRFGPLFTSPPVQHSEAAAKLVEEALRKVLTCDHESDKPAFIVCGDCGDILRDLAKRMKEQG